MEERFVAKNVLLSMNLKEIEIGKIVDAVEKELKSNSKVKFSFDKKGEF